MKTAIITLVLSVAQLGHASVGLICREDRRLANGGLREVILTPSAGGYLLQSQFVPSLNSPQIEIENWAEKLNCRIDAKASLAFCQNEEGKNVAQIKERREVFYDSLAEDAKKKTSKYTDISVNVDGKQSKGISFAAAHCEAFEGEA